MGALVALLSSLLWGSADFAGGLASRRLSSVVVVGWTQVLALVLLVPAVLLTGGFPPVAAWLWWGLAAGTVGLGGLICFYRALAIGTMGVVSPIAALGAVVPVLVAVAGGERPSAVQTFGMVLALVGAVAASGPELSSAMGNGEPDRLRERRLSVVLAAAAGAAFGLTLTFIAQGSGGPDVPGPEAEGALQPLLTVTAMRLASLAVFGVAALALRSTGGVGPAQLPGLLGIGAADAAANALYGLASTLGMVSIVAVLGSLYPVVTVLLARALLGERLQPVQVAGVGLAMTGVVLLAAG